MGDGSRVKEGFVRRWMEGWRDEWDKKGGCMRSYRVVTMLTRRALCERGGRYL